MKRIRSRLFPSWVVVFSRTLSLSGLLHHVGVVRVIITVMLAVILTHMHLVTSCMTMYVHCIHFSTVLIKVFALYSVIRSNL